MIQTAYICDGCDVTTDSDKLPANWLRVSSPFEQPKPLDRHYCPTCRDKAEADYNDRT